MTAYRKRFYQNYFTTHIGGEPLEHLASRKPFILRIIKKFFPRNKEVAIVDLGCGHGAFLYFAKQLGYTNASGVEASEDQIAMARKCGITNIVQGDVEQFLSQTPNSSVDFILLFDLLEHFDKNEALRIMDQICRVLKVQGQVLIHVPNASSPFGGRLRYGDYTHLQSFTGTSITQLLNICGFDKVACFSDRPVAHGVVSFLRLVVYLIGELVLRLFFAAETGRVNEVLSQNLIARATKK